MCDGDGEKVCWRMTLATSCHVRSDVGLVVQCSSGYFSDGTRTDWVCTCLGEKIRSQGTRETSSDCRVSAV